MSQQQIDNAAAIIIIIDDTIPRLQAIRAANLVALDTKTQNDIESQLKDAQAGAVEAETLATS